MGKRKAIVEIGTSAEAVKACGEIILAIVKSDAHPDVQREALVSLRIVVATPQGTVVSGNTFLQGEGN